MPPDLPSRHACAFRTLLSSCYHPVSPPPPPQLKILYETLLSLAQTFALIVQMGSHWNTCVCCVLIMKDVQECYQRLMSSAFHYFWSFFVLSSQKTGKAWELIMWMTSDGCEMVVGREGSTLKQHTWLHHQVYIAWLVSSPDPTCERGSGDIRLIPRASLILITFWREISLHQSHCRKDNLLCYTGNSWLLQYDDTALFWAHKLVIGSQLCIQQAMNC